MISVAKAREVILEQAQDFGVESIPFITATERVLKEPIVADRDFPPFNRVAMDGIAINYRFFEYGVRDFKIEGIQPAGSEQETMENASHCYEVMTGAILPHNTDTVIRYEDVILNNGMASVQIDHIQEGQNVHEQGKDQRKDAVLVQEDTLITPAEIGVLATVGKATVQVAKVPKVMIVATGDELVDVAATPLAHQIRKSNVYTLVSLLDALQIPSETAHLKDKKEVLKATIASYLENYDVLLFSGAVSKGKFDFLPEVLEELGVKKLFHKVAQRPGKPFWFGQTDSCKVFAFPGNPVSTFVNCMVYFYPWYAKSIGQITKQQTAILAEDVNFKPQLTYFLQVQLKNENGQLLAYPVRGNGSGDLASLVMADGFIELPKSEKTEFKKGNLYPIITYRI